MDANCLLSALTIIVGILSVLVLVLLGWQFIYFVRFERILNNRIKKRIKDIDKKYNYKYSTLKAETITNEILILSSLLDVCKQYITKDYKEKQDLPSWTLYITDILLSQSNDAEDKCTLIQKINELRQYLPIETLQEFKKIVEKTEFDKERKSAILESINYLMEKESENDRFEINE